MITRIERKTIRGNTIAFEAAVLKDVNHQLQHLAEETARWAGENIPGLYNAAINDAAKGTMALGVTVPYKAGFSVVDQSAVSILADNLNMDLQSALQAVGRSIQDDIRQAGLEATASKITTGQTVKQMRNNLIRKLTEQGLTAVQYTRKGRPVNMSLTAYAETVARSTVRETTNTARINLNQRIGNDLVKMTQHSGSCPICIPLEGRVYSISGQDTRYPPLYGTALQPGHNIVHPNCGHTFNSYIEAFDDDAQQVREYSNRSFDIGGGGWSKRQNEQAERSLRIYNAGQARKRLIYQDRKQYADYRSVLGDDAPKSFAGFRRMKHTNSEQWQFVQLDYRRRKKLINHPELGLPNAEKATAADAKFTNYLFGGNNERGIAKGRAFESRLGYNIDNWVELKKQLIDRAQLYPATAREETKFGTPYTQYMVLYGAKGKPANVVVGWLANRDKTWLTTAMIKEVK